MPNMTVEELAKLPPEQLAARLVELEQENAEISEGRAAAEGRAKDYSKKLEETERERAEARDQARRDGNAAWVASMAEGDSPRMLPAERPYAAYLLDVLTAPAGTTVKAYTEKAKGKTATGEDAEVEVEVTPAEAFKRLFALRAKGAIKAALFTQQTVTTDASQAGGEPEVKTYANQEEAREVATTRAKAYAKEHTVADFKVALKAVLDADEALKDAYAGVRPEGVAAAATGRARFARITAPARPE